MHNNVTQMAILTEVEAGGIDLAYSFALFDGEMEIGVYEDKANHDAVLLMSMMSILCQGIVIGLVIENVLGTKHYDHLNGLSEVDPMTLANVANPTQRVGSPGRNVYATLSYNR